MDILAAVTENSIVLKFEYNEEVINKVKKIQGRRYNPENKCWYFPKSSLREIHRTFGKQLAWHGEPPKELQLNKYSRDVVPWEDMHIDLSVAEQLKLPPFPYQWGGANFLFQKKRAMLADEMGVGKSIQAIVAFLLLLKERPSAKAVVFCPSSLKRQWHAEIKKFTDLEGIVIDGNAEERKKQYKEAIKHDYQMIFLNYELLYYDYEDICRVVNDHCDVMILDEAQKVKSFQAEISALFKGGKKTITDKKTKKKTTVNYEGLDTEYRWFLTGTPMENKAIELFNLFEIMRPGYFGNFFAFRNRYVVLGRFKNVIGYKNQYELHRRASEYMLRRRRSEVEQAFPDVMYSDVILPMEPAQMMAHNFVESDLEKLIEDRKYQGSFFVPEDIEDDEMQEENDSNIILGRFNTLLAIADSLELLEMSNSMYAKNLPKRLGIKKKDLKASAKVTWIEGYVKDMLENDPNEQVVIFTKFERFQRILRERLSKHCPVLILNGAMKTKEREQARLDFVNGKANVFILTDAGAKGLNLQCSKTLINADLPWNPAILEQRNGRIIRIGSKHEKVRIINLISQNSIDERVYQILREKSALFEQIIEKTEAETEAVLRLNKNIMKKLLGKKAS